MAAFDLDELIASISVRVQSERLLLATLCLNLELLQKPNGFVGYPGGASAHMMRRVLL